MCDAPLPLSQLTQRGALEQLFSNRTWGRLPSPSEIQYLPSDSEDYQIVRQWGTPNIYVTLLLYICVQVCSMTTFEVDFC